MNPPSNARDHDAPHSEKQATPQLVIGITELYTPAQRFTDAALALEDGRVAWVGPAADVPAAYASWSRTDLGGRGVLPGLIDAHTHLVWAGSRLEEYRQRAAGASYEAILAAGGGIHHTVAATRAASEAELLELALARAEVFLRGGVTTLEVKSGYGLTPQAELKLLRVIGRLARRAPQRIIPTLLAHVVPREWRREAYLEMFTSELIPEVARLGLADAVDVFCDAGAFTVAEARRIFEAAREHGLAIKAHAEQLERTGATRLVCELGGLSADHLEQATPEEWAALAHSGTVGVLLPGAAVNLRQAFPAARAMWDAGVKVALATDHNPGSSPLYSLPLALQLAIALGGLRVEEALVAATAHAADALDRPHLGRLEPGSAADFVVVDAPEALWPLYAWGDPRLQRVYLAGREVWRVDTSGRPC